MIQFEDLDLKHKQLNNFKSQAKRDCINSLNKCSKYAEELIKLRSVLDRIKNLK